MDDGRWTITITIDDRRWTMDDGRWTIKDVVLNFYEYI